MVNSDELGRVRKEEQRHGKETEAKDVRAETTTREGEVREEEEQEEERSVLQKEESKVAGEDGVVISVEGEDGAQVDKVKGNDGLSSSPAMPTTDDEAEEKKPPTRCRKILDFLFKYHLPIGLIIAIAFGVLVPQPGIEVSKAPITTIGVCIVFFLSGLKLETKELKDAVREWRALVVGLVLILFATPLLAWPIVEIPFQTEEFPRGLSFFALMPTTISSGVILTSQADGNTATALFLSVITNLVGVATLPVSISLLLLPDGAQSNTNGYIGELLGKLALTILLPLVVGKILRHIPQLKVKKFTARWKKAIKFTQSLMIIIIPWLKMSKVRSWRIQYYMRKRGRRCVHVLTMLSSSSHLYLSFSSLFLFSCSSVSIHFPPFSGL